MNYSYMYKQNTFSKVLHVSDLIIAATCVIKIIKIISLYFNIFLFQCNVTYCKMMLCVRINDLNKYLKNPNDDLIIIRPHGHELRKYSISKDFEFYLTLDFLIIMKTTSKVIVEPCLLKEVKIRIKKW